MYIALNGSQHHAAGSLARLRRQASANGLESGLRCTRALQKLGQKQFPALIARTHLRKGGHHASFNQGERLAPAVQQGLRNQLCVA